MNKIGWHLRTTTVIVPPAVLMRSPACLWVMSALSCPSTCRMTSPRCSPPSDAGDPVNTCIILVKGHGDLRFAELFCKLDTKVKNTNELENSEYSRCTITIRMRTITKESLSNRSYFKFKSKYFKFIAYPLNNKWLVKIGAALNSKAPGSRKTISVKADFLDTRTSHFQLTHREDEIAGSESENYRRTET